MKGSLHKSDKSGSISWITSANLKIGVVHACLTVILEADDISIHLGANPIEQQNEIHKLPAGVMHSHNISIVVVMHRTRS